MIKQLHARIVDLCEHFLDRPAFNVLESSRKALETLLEDAEKFAKWSLSFRPNAS